MAEIKMINILHLYHDLMNLYGDWANAAVLERELVSRGLEVELNKKSVGDDIDFESYDFIYIGSGTERSLLACMRDLTKYKDVFLAGIEAGVPVLSTGNSHELFGRVVLDANENRFEMLGLLDFETKQQHTRVTGDCVSKASFLDQILIGFINRAGGSQQGDIKRPFYIEPGEGAGYAASPEGIQYKNLLGTYMTGPVLVRNPPLLKYFADMILKQAGISPGKAADSVDNDLFFTYQEKAYKSALKSVNMEQKSCPDVIISDK